MYPLFLFTHRLHLLVKQGAMKHLAAYCLFCTSNHLQLGVFVLVIGHPGEADARETDARESDGGLLAVVGERHAMQRLLDEQAAESRMRQERVRIMLAVQERVSAEAPMRLFC